MKTKKIEVLSYSFFTYKKATKNEIDIFEINFKHIFYQNYTKSFSTRNSKMYESIFKFENSIILFDNDILNFLVSCFDLNQNVEKIITKKNYDGWECDVTPNQNVNLTETMQLAKFMSDKNIQII